MEEKNDAVKKRSWKDPEERRMQVSALRAQGLTFRAIAEELGVSVSLAHKDADKARDMWRERASQHFEDHIADVLATIDVAQREAFEAWNASKGERVTTTETTRNGDSTLTVKTQHSAGDPRFLVVIERLVDQRIRALTGLKGDAASGRTLSEFLAMGRKGATIELSERRVIAKT